MHTSQDTEGVSGSAARSAPAAGVSSRGWWVVPLVLVALHFVVAVPLILHGTMTGRWGEDHVNYHEPAVRTFAQELPTPNLRDYHSATTPGYHLIVAAASRFFGDSQATLQLIGSLFTAALLGTFGAVVAIRYRAVECRGISVKMPGGSERSWFPTLLSLAVCLPLACSMYVFQAGVWLLPDNAGWLGVLLVMVVALRFRASVGTLATGAAALAMLVMFRQIHIWAAGLLWVGAWLSVHDSPRQSESVKELVTYPSLRLRRALGAFVATMPAFGVLFMFHRMWGGLTPGEFQGQYNGFNPAAPAFILAVLGVASVFFVGFITDGLWLLLTRKRALLGAAVLIGLIASVVPRTSLSVPDGRFSGLWKVAEKLPLIAEHTAPGIVALAVLGSIMAAAWFVSLPWRERWFFLAALCGFTAAQSASFQIWQRYNEPFVLMLLALVSSSVLTTHVRTDNETASSSPRSFPFSRLVPAMRLVGPLALAVFLVLVAYVTMRNAPPANRSVSNTFFQSPHDTPAP